jgi:hypothetical protein
MSRLARRTAPAGNVRFHSKSITCIKRSRRCSFACTGHSQGNTLCRHKTLVRYARPSQIRSIDCGTQTTLHIHPRTRERPPRRAMGSARGSGAQPLPRVVIGRPLPTDGIRSSHAHTMLNLQPATGKSSGRRKSKNPRQTGRHRHVAEYVPS